MILKQASTPASALSARSERPFKFVWPTAAPDGSVGYDHPLENYFDASMAPRLLPPHPPSRLYDTIARAHDQQFQVSSDMIDPSGALSLNQRDRRRSLANIPGNSTDYMGISPDLPGWRPRRSSYEDRRGAVGVTPSEVNTLVPYIPPIDASMPPPKEWLDEMAKRFLADAHADFNDSHHKNTKGAAPASSLNADNSPTFDYDSDATLDGPVTIPCAHAYQPQHHIPQVQSNSTTDTETEAETDTDTDTSSDDGYDWNTTHFHFPDSKWIIPRKRPSVVIVDKDASRSIIPSSNDERPGKRRKVKGSHSKRTSKTPKKYESDAPVRRAGECIGLYRISELEHDDISERVASSQSSSIGGATAITSHPPVSSITATALQMKHVRITSPCPPSSPIIPQSNTTPSPSKPPKLFPCLLDGCTQICASAGDLQRHQQSLRHRAPSYACLACGKSYTRSDALKRHLNSKAACRRAHATKLANEADLEQVPAEANAEAV